jgi:hypothetical protein
MSAHESEIIETSEEGTPSKLASSRRIAGRLDVARLPYYALVGYSKRGQSRVERDGDFSRRCTVEQAQAFGNGDDGSPDRTAGSNIAATLHEEERSDAREV